jgi:hypothetical protein
MKLEPICISKALRLSKLSVESLLKGSSIVAIPRTFIPTGSVFALYPDRQDLEEVTIHTWAVCEQCDLIDTSKPLEIMAGRESFFLIYLRVYQLPKPISIPANSQSNYIALPNRLMVDRSQPVLSDRDFTRLKQRIENFEPPETLEEQIERMLGEVELQRRIETNREHEWIETISTLGDRSIKEDQGKSNYQAGTDFEDIAKRSLEFLGFTIDESHKGGAGGLDLFCSKPYPLVGECKAGKSVPSGTTEELIKLGGMRLGYEKFRESSKLIVGAGKINPDVITAAKEWKISIIKAMTLQKLVELKAKYDGAIDLFELKKHLHPGQIDVEIGKYIQKVEEEIKLRSHIVSLVKKANREVGINYIMGVFDGSNYPKSLAEEELKDILIELASPLAGYLGRVEENGKKSDRFYYLRDLPI